jgi:hypothetical protein
VFAPDAGYKEFIRNGEKDDEQNHDSWDAHYLSNRKDEE